MRVFRAGVAIPQPASIPPTSLIQPAKYLAHFIKHYVSKCG